MGLSTREDSLRAMEAEYASPLLSRVVDSMVRSLRFGTPMSESLEAAAIEARETHRARMEERVAKVAVKMMLPVGALILPAMLLLVMGPVLLELMDGF
jgi:tight adherence protein C